MSGHSQTRAGVHASGFGRFGCHLWAVADAEGYIRHRPEDVAQLRAQPDEELERLVLADKLGLVKNAALLVLAERALAAWRAAQ